MWTAFFASLFLATDLMWAISNFEAMSEPLFVFLVLFSVERLSLALFPETSVKARSRAILEAGLLLGLATLTRPVALYLVIVEAAIVGFSGLRRPRLANRLSEAAILMIATLVLPAGWILRNYSVFEIPRLTYIDLNNLVYFVGAGAYQVECGLEREAAQQAISDEFRIPPYRVVQNSQTTDYPLTRIVAELREVWPRVVFKYPRSLILSSAGAILKATGSHNVAQLADLTCRTWTPPKTGDLIRFRAEAFERLGKNGGLLALVFSWQLVHTILLFSTFLLGVALIVRNPRYWPVGILCFTILCYFYLTIALFGFDAYCRCRMPVLPFLDLIAGLGVGGLAAFLIMKPVRAEHEIAV